MIKVEMDPGPRCYDKQPHHTERKRPHGFYIVLEDGTSLPIPIGFMRKSEMKALESLLNGITRSQERPALDVEAVLKDLHDQEVFPERHPVSYSPDQVRKTLTRFVTIGGSITMERSNHETRTQRDTSND
jgi:hypothetical protein